MRKTELRTIAQSIAGSGIFPYGSPHRKMTVAASAATVRIFDNFAYFRTSAYIFILSFPVRFRNSSISRIIRSPSRSSIFLFTLLTNLQEFSKMFKGIFAYRQLTPFKYSRNSFPSIRYHSILSYRYVVLVNEETYVIPAPLAINAIFGRSFVK